MDYRKHYDALMNRAKARGTRKKDLPFYTERHRIVPGCMGGKYTKSNIALLTPEEHYVAHQLLVKMYPEHGGLVKGARMMTMNSKNHGENRSPNKIYGWLRRRYVNECKKRTGENNASYGRHWYWDPYSEDEGMFLDHEIPDDWIPGRNPVYSRPQKTERRYCKECKIQDIGVEKVNNKKQYCNTCRNKSRHHRNVSDKEIIDALKEHRTVKGALQYLKLSCGGDNYRRAKELSNRNRIALEKRKVAWVNFVCAQCGETSYREKRQTYQRKRLFCSNKCSGKFYGSRNRK